MNDQLKPCPFCGSPAMVFGGGSSSRMGKVPYHVECASRLCYARTGDSINKEVAIEKWNTRTNKT